MEKIVALNSGGFDSVVLLNYLRDKNPDSEIYSLHFLYDARNERGQINCVEKVCNKIKAVNEVMRIPRFTWTSGKFYSLDYETSYLEFRNLIFLSYAVSYAESIGAKKIYCAFIYPETEYYTDTSPRFIEAINNVTKIVGIEVIAPFIRWHKDKELRGLALKYNISRYDVHSCDVSNTPCGKCADCKSLDEIYEWIDSFKYINQYINNGFKMSDSMIINMQSEKIKTVKLYINNGCQFTCSHCFLTGVELKHKELDIDEWKNIIVGMKEYGIENVDLFGKEPLLNDKFIPIIEELNNKGFNVSLITNGYNIDNFIGALDRLHPDVTVSIEGVGVFEHNLNRDIFVDKMFGRNNILTMLIHRGLNVSVSIDLNVYNYITIDYSLERLYTWGVHNFYLKPIRPFGKSEEYIKESMDKFNLYSLISKVSKFAEKYKGVVKITLALSTMDYYTYIKDDKVKTILNEAINNRSFYYKGIDLDIEFFCGRFLDSIAISADGYVMGCAGEMCVDDFYDDNLNLREYTIEECIKYGKTLMNKDMYKYKGCYYAPLYRKELNE